MSTGSPFNIESGGSYQSISQTDEQAGSNHVAPSKFGSCSTECLIVVLLILPILIIFVYTREPTLCVPGMCCAGTSGFMNNTPGVQNQLAWKIWTSDDDIQLPYYSTGNLDNTSQLDITSAIIVQHGLQRDANVYFCAAWDSLYSITSLNLSDAPNFNNTIIIAPQVIHTNFQS